MYISQEQLKARLTGSLKIEQSKAGGAKKGLSHEERVLMAALAQVDSQENVAKQFGVSQPLVSNLSRGLTDGVHLDKKLVEDTKAATPKEPRAVGTISRDAAGEAALDTLMDALGIVKENLNDKTKPIDASAIAKNMAVIIDKMQPPKKEKEGASHVFVTINAPKQKEEKDFDFIEVETVQA